MIGVFFGARSLGVGTAVRDSEWISQWAEEGEAWASRVGRRYGMFGFEKGSSDETPLTPQLAENVTNAVVAYAATKVSLQAFLRPLLISISILRCFFQPGLVSHSGYRRHFLDES
jgi:hypothetical protein